MSALVFEDGARPNEPRTHVLILGVGAYPALAKQTGLRDVRLGQLSSPGPSARALATWFLQHYHYPDAPLGSLSLLLSEAAPSPYIDPQGRSFLAPRATYSAFSDAAHDWCERGAHPGSRLVFMFCGHGFGNTEETSLLLEDFDESRRDCWDQALDLKAFTGGLEEVPASEQLFFIDACRLPHPVQVGPRSRIGRSPVYLRSSDPRAELPRLNAPVIFSTGADQPARGRTDGVSVFTTAFLKAMAGMGARDDDGEWRVHNLSLLEAMDHVSSRLTQEAFSTPQQPQGAEARKFDLHHLREAPICPIYVERDGDLSDDEARLRYGDGSASGTILFPAMETEIEVSLPFGRYEFELLDELDQVVARAGRESRPTYKKAKLEP